MKNHLSIISMLVLFAIPMLRNMDPACLGTDVKDFGQLNPNAPPETEQFGRLVGAWDCTIANLNADGSWSTNQATWIWKYILDGYAIQDHWLNPVDLEKNPQGRDLYGTNLRIFNPQLKIWQNAWLENGNNSMSGIWEAKLKDDGSIHMYDETGDWRIKFYNITEDSFDWQWDFKQEDGMMLTSVIIQGKRRNE